MTKSIRDSKKSKIGRPKTTGPGQPQVVRMHDQQIAEIDSWIASQEAEISRPEAIRRLVELGLTVKARPTQGSRVRADKANAMAADQLDQLADESATADERASRKRRLLQGPEEFQSVRVDRPAKKK